MRYFPCTIISSGKCQKRLNLSDTENIVDAVPQEDIPFWSSCFSNICSKLTFLLFFSCYMYVAALSVSSSGDTFLPVHIKMSVILLSF